MASIAQTDPDMLEKRESDGPSQECTLVDMPLLFFTPHSNTSLIPSALTFSKIWRWFTWVTGLVSSGHKIYSGALTLINVFSAPFSWLQLISAVDQIGSGVKTLVRTFTRLLSRR